MFGLGFAGNVGHFWFLSCFFHNHLAINAHVCISPNPAKLLYLRYRRYGGLDKFIKLKLRYYQSQHALWHSGSQSGNGWSYLWPHRSTYILHIMG
ncbi:hypothetical protein Bca4012_004914 [Brassica carinata]